MNALIIILQCLCNVLLFLLIQHLQDRITSINKIHRADEKTLRALFELSLKEQSTIGEICNQMSRDEIRIRNLENVIECIAQEKGRMEHVQKGK